MLRLMQTADDYALYEADSLGFIIGLINIMEDQVLTNQQTIEKELNISLEVMTSRVQQSRVKDITESLLVELDAARLLDLETVPMSYKTMEQLCQLLTGLRERIQKQDTEITQLRNRISGSIGNQPQESVYRESNRKLVF